MVCNCSVNVWNYKTDRWDPNTEKKTEQTVLNVRCTASIATSFTIADLLALFQILMFPWNNSTLLSTNILCTHYSNMHTWYDYCGLQVPLTDRSSPAGMCLDDLAFHEQSAAITYLNIWLHRSLVWEKPHLSIFTVSLTVTAYPKFFWQSRENGNSYEETGEGFHQTRWRGFSFSSFSYLFRKQSGSLV